FMSRTVDPDCTLKNRRTAFPSCPLFFIISLIVPTHHCCHAFFFCYFTGSSCADRGTTSNFICILKSHGSRLMPHRRYDLICQILHPELQAGSIDAGMASEILILQHILVDQKPHLLLMVVHQAEYAHRSGRDIKILLHVLWFRKGQPGGTDLCRQIFCLKRLVPGNQKKIKLCLLTVAQEQVLTDRHTVLFSFTERPVDLLARLHGHCRLMVDPLIIYAQ